MASETRPKAVVRLSQHWMSSTSTQWVAHVDIGWHELRSVARYTPEATMREQFNELISILKSQGYSVEVKDG